jgi:UDPglucose 6-dehydrogenase
VGADVNMVRKGIGSDQRIGGKFLYAGCGYGGSCFPKDVKALIKTAEIKGYELKVLKAVEEVNAHQKQVLFHKLQRHFDGELSDKTICIWGLSFKPNTDDMREAPSLVLIEKLLQAGCKIRTFDPVAMPEAKEFVKNNITTVDTSQLYFANDIYDAVLGTDALLLVTEWKEFRMPSWGVVKKSMNGSLIIDGRNIYDKKEMNELGFVYDPIG